MSVLFVLRNKAIVEKKIWFIKKKSIILLLI